MNQLCELINAVIRWWTEMVVTLRRDSDGATITINMGKSDEAVMLYSSVCGPIFVTKNDYVTDVQKHLTRWALDPFETGWRYDFTENMKLYHELKKKALEIRDAVKALETAECEPCEWPKPIFNEMTIDEFAKEFNLDPIDVIKMTLEYFGVFTSVISKDLKLCPFMVASLVDFYKLKK